MNSIPQHLLFGPFPEPVRFRRCDELIEPVLSIFSGWDIRPAPAGAPSPLMRLAGVPGGYRRVSCWQHTPSLARGKTRRTVVEAVCGFHFEFIDWYIARHPHHLFLHGAGVVFGGKLVLLPALAKAGKSTLSVALAQAGAVLYGDDVMPIDTTTHQAIALGIQARLRTIPDDAEPAFRAFVEARMGPTNDNRLYVLLRDGEIAPPEQRADVGGIVLLERVPGAEARLTAADPADALEKIILQNFAGDVPAPEALDSLHTVVSGAACYALRYGRSADAVALLTEAFA